LVLVFSAGAARAAEDVELEIINRIRDEGLRRSQVMETLRVLTDEIGPRLSASPPDEAARAWAAQKFRDWGLVNVALEPFEFGEGWTFSRCEVRVVAPFTVPVAALPRAWTPGTQGTVRGRAVRAKLESAEDLEKQKGKLKGAIVLLDEARTKPAVELEGKPELSRYEKTDLERLQPFEIPGERDESWRERARKAWVFWPQLAKFLEDEGVVALVELSSRDHGILRLGGGGSRGAAGRPRGTPSIAMAEEPYLRIVRLLDHDNEVELELTIDAEFHPGDGKARNVVAEIAGTDKGGGLVLAGAHLDSWHAGTGANDNAAGSAVVMEAARILKALGVKPRRTMRFLLWSAEEQGLLGSRAYVAAHYATRPLNTDPEEAEYPASMRKRKWPITPLPDHAKVSAYFNLDNGGGRIRGIYAQENVAAAPIFRAWLEPWHDLGAETVSTNATGSTDHVPFDEVGIPAFQFIQDPLDYTSRTHHTQLDTYERAPREDMMQAATIMAAFVYQAAMREAPLPRKPLPREPLEKPKKPKEGEKEPSGVPAAASGKGVAGGN
jgi:hypothetical protein